MQELEGEVEELTNALETRRYGGMGLGYVCVCVCVAPCKIHDNTKKGFFVDMMDVGGVDFV